MATWNAYGLGVKLNLGLNLSCFLANHLTSLSTPPPRDAEIKSTENCYKD